MSEINDLVKALDDNNKKCGLPSSHRRWAIRVGHFRKFFYPSGTDEIKPSRSGVALRLHEWWKFVDIIKTIDNAYPALTIAVPCYTGDDHLNHLGVQNATRLKLTELTVRTNSDMSDSM